MPQPHPHSLPFQQNRIFTLNEPNAPRLNPALACEIGLNESLVLLQLEFWIAISNNEKDGMFWTYQSVRDIQAKIFPFWSLDTINRAIKSLESKGLIITTTKYNALKYDKTRWFALNFQELDKLHSISIKWYHTGSTQNRTGSMQDHTPQMQDRTASPSKHLDITDNNTSTAGETTTETSLKTTTDSVPPPLPDTTLPPPPFSSEPKKKIIPKELYPNREIPLPDFYNHDVKDMMQSIPESKRSKAVEKVIEQALLNHGVDDIKSAIAYTLKNSNGNKQQFKAYLGKTLENSWFEGYEPETANFQHTAPLSDAEKAEEKARAKTKAKHEALNSFKSKYPDKYLSIERQAATTLGYNLEKLKPGEAMIIKFKVMQLMGL